MDTPRTDSPPERLSLLPPLLLRPHFLIWTWVIPQAILLLLNYSNYQLAKGEMNDEQHGIAMLWACLNVSYLIGAAVCAWFFHKRNKPLPIRFGLLLLLLQSAYIITSSFTMEDVLPREVTFWMLSEPQLMFQQWTWSMPAAFYGTLLMAGLPLKFRKGQDIILCVLGMIGGPLAIYVIAVLLDGFMRDIDNVAPYLIGIVFAVCTILMGICLLRLLLHIFGKLFSGNRLGNVFFTLVVALFMPLGGLALNTRIPFPADYQDGWVYAMTVINALLLILPVTADPRKNLWLYLARCVSFAFTLYFFVVFLPFLPLAIPALLVVGAGFLILSPTCLFVVHIKKIQELLAAGLPTGTKTTVLLGLAAFSVMPLYITAEGLLIRKHLMEGLDYVYAPDLSEETAPPNAYLVTRATEWLHEYNNGRFLPYLSQYRSWLMFDNLVLPQKKLERIHETFAGVPLNEVKLGQYPFSFDVRANNSRDFSRRLSEPPVQDVELTSTSLVTKAQEGLSKATLTISMTAQDHWQSEFVTHLKIPEGVLVSNFWLHIGDERKPGQLYEKKAAMWVYRMIRDGTRRDPGLLFYTASDELELRVFPFARNEQRTVEIEFTYPTGLAGEISIGERSESLGETLPVVQTLRQNDTALLLLNQQAAAQLPTRKRTPYLHLIVDRSVDAMSQQELSEAVMQLMTQLPDVPRQARLTAMNYQAANTAEGNTLQTLEDVKEHVAAYFDEADSPPPTGGFLPDRAIMQALYDYKTTALTTKGDSIRYPIFVILSKREEPDIALDLSSYRPYIPECHQLILADGQNFRYFNWDGKDSEFQGFDSEQEVVVLKSGDSIRMVDPNSVSTLIDFEQTNTDTIEVLNQDDSFTSLSEYIAPLPSDDTYQRGLVLQAQTARAEQQPSLKDQRIAGIVHASRAHGVLTPYTAYIVVENTAQEEMLKRTEKKKLNSKSELGLMDTPEPSVWLLAGILLVFELCRRYRLRGHFEDRKGNDRT